MKTTLEFCPTQLAPDVLRAWRRALSPSQALSRTPQRAPSAIFGIRGE
jgi:hypothetical protein